MKKKTTSSGNMPAAEQEFFCSPLPDLGMTNAKPRCTEFDLRPTPSRTRIGEWGDSMTFTADRRGNKVTEGGNY